MAANYAFLGLRSQKEKPKFMKVDHSKMKNIGKMNVHLYVLIMELDIFSNMTHI